MCMLLRVANFADASFVVAHVTVAWEFSWQISQLV